MDKLRTGFQVLKEYLLKSNVFVYILIFMDKTKNRIGSALMCCWLTLIDLVHLYLPQKTKNYTGNSSKSLIFPDTLVFPSRNSYIQFFN